jgi:hypothetical protein
MAKVQSLPSPAEIKAAAEKLKRAQLKRKKAEVSPKFNTTPGRAGWFYVPTDGVSAG